MEKKEYTWGCRLPMMHSL